MFKLFEKYLKLFIKLYRILIIITIIYLLYFFYYQNNEMKKFERLHKNIYNHTA